MFPEALAAAAAAGSLSRTVVLWAIRGEIHAALAPTSSPRRRLQVAARRRLALRAEHVTLSPAMAAEFDAVGLPVSNTVIPVPVDRRHFRPPTPDDRDSSRAELGIAPDAFTIVYVGHLQERKCVDRLVSALAEIRGDVQGANLLVVGGGRGAGDDTETALRRQVADAGLEGSVLFAGIARDPRRYLWASDVLALASSREGMPNSLLEALACGLPCVAPVSAGGGEVLDVETGVVPSSNDVAAIADALRMLAGDVHARRRMGQAARERSERYDVERVADEYARLYERVAMKATES
jgi:glycosyltransferase involved in cell wall biosynthesis